MRSNTFTAFIDSEFYHFIFTCAVNSFIHGFLHLNLHTEFLFNITNGDNTLPFDDSPFFSLMLFICDEPNEAAIDSAVGDFLLGNDFAVMFGDEDENRYNCFTEAQTVVKRTFPVCATVNCRNCGKSSEYK
jgi:hypothetical protein